MYVVQTLNLVFYGANNNVFTFDRQGDYSMVSGDDDRGGGVGGDRRSDVNTAVPHPQENICNHQA